METCFGVTVSAFSDMCMKPLKTSGGFSETAMVDDGYRGCSENIFNHILKKITFSCINDESFCQM